MGGCGCVWVGVWVMGFHFICSLCVFKLLIVILKDEDADALEGAVNDSLTWCERVVLPHLCRSSTTSTTTVPKSRNQRKRRCNQSLVPCDEDVIHDLAGGVVKVCVCACVCVRVHVHVCLLTCNRSKQLMVRCLLQLVHEAVIKLEYNNTDARAKII